MFFFPVQQNRKWKQIFYKLSLFDADVVFFIEKTTISNIWAPLHFGSLTKTKHLANRFSTFFSFCNSVFSGSAHPTIYEQKNGCCPITTTTKSIFFLVKHFWDFRNEFQQTTSLLSFKFNFGKIFISCDKSRMKWNEKVSSGWWWKCFLCDQCWWFSVDYFIAILKSFLLKHQNKIHIFKNSKLKTKRNNNNNKRGDERLINF